jgi:hypothetical protein
VDAATQVPEGLLLIHGRVVFADGSPVKGARVDLISSGAALSPASDRGHSDATTHTDTDGRYEFLADGDLDRLGGNRNLIARQGERLCILAVAEDAEAPYLMPDLVLVDGLTIIGRIVDAAGKPVPGAHASIWASWEGLTEYHTLVARSDVEGKVSFHPVRRVEGWSMTLTVIHPEFPETELEIDAADQLAGKPFEAVLPSGFTVTGRVVDIDGMGKQGVEVVAARLEDGEYELVSHLRTVTDLEGKFTLPGVPAGAVRLLVFPGQEETLEFFNSRRIIPYRSAVVSGRNGSVAEVGTITFGARGDIRGTVLDADGLPIEGAMVRASPGIRMGGYATVQSDADGRFVLGDLPSGAYEVTARKDYPKLGTRSAATQEVQTGAPELTFHVRGGNAIVLHFHPADSPSEELPVKGYLLNATKLPKPPPRKGGGFSGRGGHRTLSTRAQAHFRLDKETGRYEVTVTVSGYEPVDFGEVTVHPDRDTELDVLLREE